MVNMFYQVINYQLGGPLWMVILERLDSTTASKSGENNIFRLPLLVWATSSHHSKREDSLVIITLRIKCGMHCLCSHTTRSCMHACFCFLKFDSILWFFCRCWFRHFFFKGFMLRSERETMSSPNSNPNANWEARVYQDWSASTGNFWPQFDSEGNKFQDCSLEGVSWQPSSLDVNR